MKINTDQLPTYKTLPPVRKTQTTYLACLMERGVEIQTVVSLLGKRLRSVFVGQDGMTGREFSAAPERHLSIRKNIGG